MTRDLHASGFAPNYVSEHEAKFSGQGVPIKFVIMARGNRTFTLDPVVFGIPRSVASRYPECDMTAFDRFMEAEEEEGEE